MDLDFILFTPPKIKYTFMDLWGEVIFIPKTRKKEKPEPTFGSFLNCYKASTVNDVQLTVESALLQAKGSFQCDLQTQQAVEDEQVQKYIPCLYLNSMVGSKYLILYFHASGQDIKLSHKLLDHLRNLYQTNVLAMEYSGYSIYKGKTSSQTIKSDASYVYSYIVGKLGFKQSNIIVIGRSIGTGIALDLMQRISPGALALISPFASIKLLAKQFLGSLGHFFAKQTYDNKTNILTVNCPTFIVHGKKDDVISFQNSVQLAKLCYSKKCLLNPSEMDHSSFDFYTDFSQPLRDFLMSHDFNFYEPHMKGPEIPQKLFVCPEGFKI